ARGGGGNRPRRGGGLAVRARQAVPRLRARVLDRSEEGGMAHAQGDDPDDRGGICIRPGDGDFSLDQRQDTRVGAVRPASRMEKDMTATGNKRWYVVTLIRDSRSPCSG